MSQCPIDASPWQPFADYYFAGTPTRGRVATNWGAMTDRYQSVLTSGDDIADRLAVAMIGRNIRRSDFEMALQHGIDQVDHADPILQAFFSSIDRMPAGIDMAAVERGSRVLRTVPITVLLTHGIVAGFVFAAINPNSAIPLSLNQTIAAATQRRYIETTKYVADTVTAGGLNRFGDGLMAACRVRLVHAFVRTEIRRHFQWNDPAYDAPIHAIALLAAAAVPDVWAVRFAQKHGCRFSDQDLQDVASHNAYLAYLHGVPEWMLPTDYDSFCDALCWAICQSTVPLPADRHRALSVLTPLLKNGYPLSTNRVVNWFYNQTVLTATRTIIGDQICDAYDIPPSRHAKSLSAGLAMINRLLVTARATPAVQSIYQRGTERYWDVSIPAICQQITGHREVSYASTAKTTG